MNDSFEFTLHSPLTQEDWNKLTDAELENTTSITYQTPQGRKVKLIEIPEEMNRVIKQDMLDGLMPQIADYMQIITFERPIDMMVEVAGQIKVVNGIRHDNRKG